MTNVASKWMVILGAKAAEAVSPVLNRAGIAPRVQEQLPQGPDTQAPELGM